MVAELETHPVSPWQNLQIAARNDPDTAEGYHQKMIIRWAHLVTPTVDARRLKRAFDGLVKRHDSLRLEFCQEGTEWRAHILPGHPTGIVTESFGDVDNAEFENILAKRATAPLDILEDTLFQMQLLRFGSRGDVIMVRAHHAILDGYSAVLLVEELFQAFLNIPPTNRAISHGEFVRFLATDTKKNLAGKNKFWEDALLPIGDAPHIGRKAKGKPRISGLHIQSTSSLSDLISLKELDTLDAIASESGHSLFAHLFTAFADTLCDTADCDSLLLATVVGRTDPILSGFIGSASTLMLVRYERLEGDSFADKARRTAQSIQQGIAHLPWRGYAEGGPVADALTTNNRDFHQFLVSQPTALGRARGSSFSKSIESGQNGEISFGHFAVTKIDLPAAPPTNAELEFIIGGDGGSEIRLAADAEAFSQKELKTLKTGIRAKLGLPT